MISVQLQLASLVDQALQAAQAVGDLPALSRPEIEITRGARPEHGDYASNVGMKLARAARAAPMKIAEVVVKHLPESELVARAEVAPPGFINFTLRPDWLTKQVESILAEGSRFGDVDLGGGARVQIEFVSANPTGPLHAGAARGAALGDALANILTAAGYEVQREYYVNDAGSRMDVFYQSVYARYLQACGRDGKVPEEGYHGHYVLDAAQELRAEHGDRFLDGDANAAATGLGQLALHRMVQGAREDLDRMGVHFDNWYSEQSLYNRGTVLGTVELLEERGQVVRREGAVWFVTTAEGDEKDNVLVRSNGSPTYFASDIAYHRDKFLDRGFDQVIDIWGADHHGHVPRMKAAVGALGVSPDRLTILLYQLVTLKRGNEVVRLSKRTGDIIALREVLDEVGADATRFFLLQRSANSQMEFDLELAKEQKPENPVFYVQYAHARIASIQRHAEAQGVAGAGGDVSLLTSQPELTLIRKLLQFPDVVAESARQQAPHHLTYFAQELAATFHAFYRDCRVVSDDPALSAARLLLVRAAKVVLARALGLMGVTAPERMEHAEDAE
ncbi:MAG: arginine--tRNA ligase [Chloroflexi bacterium]|nr:arginine--tRNA ligase [Chloroflexota bacterium]